MPNEEFCPNHATGGIVYLIDTLHVSKIGVTRMRIIEPCADERGLAR